MADAETDSAADTDLAADDRDSIWLMLQILIDMLPIVIQSAAADTDSAAAKTDSAAA